ncbi:hypothetical protein LSTR_LSTR014055 [Laodelphax striatellus]|uniref:Uncharacterized protein n=1 Tax=Laodelphax striatellus TaxID=195883 RepID=A0A482XT67_LAOST|nr:hypothetical protein LSTR_LSTR014055 [Laodelphax striatellus]
MLTVVFGRSSDFNRPTVREVEIGNFRLIIGDTILFARSCVGCESAAGFVAVVAGKFFVKNSDSRFLHQRSRLAGNSQEFRQLLSSCIKSPESTENCMQAYRVWDWTKKKRAGNREKKKKKEENDVERMKEKES